MYPIVEKMLVKNKEVLFNKKRKYHEYKNHLFMLLIFYLFVTFCTK